MITPITKQEAQKNRVFPDAVIQAFNEFLTKGYGTIMQDEIIARILEIDSTISKEQIFKEKWLDIDNYYRDAGWTVYYDKPSYNESYNAYWRFS